MICLTWHRVLNYCDNSLSWMKHEPARKKQDNCHETDSLLYLYFFRRSLEIHPCRRLRNTHGRERFYASTISTSFIIKFYSRLLALNICWGVTRANVLCMFFFFLRHMKILSQTNLPGNFYCRWKLLNVDAQHSIVHYGYLCVRFVLNQFRNI